MKASITDRSRSLAQLIRQRSLFLLQSESPKVLLRPLLSLHQRSREKGITFGEARESPKVSLRAQRLQLTASWALEPPRWPSNRRSR